LSAPLLALFHLITLFFRALHIMFARCEFDAAASAEFSREYDKAHSPVNQWDNDTDDYVSYYDESSWQREKESGNKNMGSLYNTGQTLYMFSRHETTRADKQSFSQFLSKADHTWEQDHNMLLDYDDWEDIDYDYPTIYHSDLVACKKQEILIEKQSLEMLPVPKMVAMGHMMYGCGETCVYYSTDWQNSVKCIQIMRPDGIGNDGQLVYMEDYEKLAYSDLMSVLVPMLRGVFTPLRDFEDKLKRMVELKGSALKVKYHDDELFIDVQTDKSVEDRINSSFRLLAKCVARSTQMSSSYECDGDFHWCDIYRHMLQTFVESYVSGVDVKGDLLSGLPQVLIQNECSLSNLSDYDRSNLVAYSKRVQFSKIFQQECKMAVSRREFNRAQFRQDLSLNIGAHWLLIKKLSMRSRVVYINMLRGYRDGMLMNGPRVYWPRNRKMAFNVFVREYQILDQMIKRLCVMAQEHCDMGVRAEKKAKNKRKRRWKQKMKNE